MNRLFELLRALGEHRMKDADQVLTNAPGNLMALNWLKCHIQVLDLAPEHRTRVLEMLVGATSDLDQDWLRECIRPSNWGISNVLRFAIGLELLHHTTTCCSSKGLQIIVAGDEKFQASCGHALSLIDTLKVPLKVERFFS